MAPPIAIIPRPGSTVDQIATSLGVVSRQKREKGVAGAYVVAKRKSSVRARVLIKGIRINAATPALYSVSISGVGWG